ncbi:MAG: winged helix-turn-helix domain-containing protein [Thermoproteota archaeon]
MEENNEKKDFNYSRAELFEALGHPIRIKILESLDETPLGFSELKKKVGIESSGHLQFHLSKLNGLVETTPEGSYKLTDDGREALRILGTAKKTAEAEIKHDSKKEMRRFMTTYSFIVFLVLTFLSLYLLAYREWVLPPNPPLEQVWHGNAPFHIKSNQSITITYTINYNRIFGGTMYNNNATMIIIEDYNAPENTFEVYEYDLGRYSFDFDPGGGGFMVRVYSPEGKLLNEWEGEPMDEGLSCGGGLGWLIDKQGTYRIVISNFNSSEREVRGTFQFTRNRFQKPYAKIGYVTLSLALIYLIGVLVIYISKRLKK